MTIGEALKRFRKEFKLTQDDIAKVLNVTRQAYHSYETDKANPPSQKILELANEYNVSTDYLLGLTNKPHYVEYNEEEIKSAFALRDAFKSVIRDSFKSCE